MSRPGPAPTEEFQLKSSVCPTLPSAWTAGMLKQSECFVLVIKGIWVLSGITDRKHPNTSPRVDKCSAKADCHYGEQRQESAGLTAPRPQMRDGGGAACSADLVCGGVIHPRPRKKCLLSDPRAVWNACPHRPQAGGLHCLQTLELGTKVSACPQIPDWGGGSGNYATDPRIWSTVFI